MKWLIQKNRDRSKEVGGSVFGGKSEGQTGAVGVGDHCYIGSQSIIARGVSIGSQCVVGANSFVNENVADRTIVGGTPARPIGRVVVDDANISLCYDLNDCDRREDD